MPEYLLAHVEEALAVDPRVSEQGLRASLEAGWLVVRGAVATDERRRAVALVAAEVAPDLRLRNRTEVAARPEPPEPEVVA